jgi:hypothetical protein
MSLRSGPNSCSIFLQLKWVYSNIAANTFRFLPIPAKYLNSDASPQSVSGKPKSLTLFCSTRIQLSTLTGAGGQSGGRAATRSSSQKRPSYTTSTSSCTLTTYHGRSSSMHTRHGEARILHALVQVNSAERPRLRIPWLLRKHSNRLLGLSVATNAVPT